jgi:fatty acid desaturase
LFAAEIGFNIQHDGGHQAYSNVPWINKLKLTSWFFGFRALCCS